MSTLPIRNGNRTNIVPLPEAQYRGEYLTYKEWKPEVSICDAAYRLQGEYLTYKEWKRIGDSVTTVLERDHK